MIEQTGTLDKEIRKRVTLRYWLSLPDSLGSQTGCGGEKLPLLLFLHGAGERGDDLERVKVHGIPSFLKRQSQLPFLLAAPLCPKEITWLKKSDDLLALLEELCSLYPVDETRIYLTGLSMGGYGTWDLAIKRPERFAAIVPICGGGDKKLASRLKDVPVWAFHGAEDQIVPPEESKEMVQAVKACGGSARLTVYPQVDHRAWPQTYEDDEMYGWLFAQRRQ